MRSEVLATTDVRSCSFVVIYRIVGQNCYRQLQQEALKDSSVYIKSSQ